MSTLKTVIFVIVLLAIGYVLLPYVKVKPKTSSNQNQQQSQNSNSDSMVQTFNSDDLGVSFLYNQDQDGDGKADTAAKQVNDKVYVYYTASAVEQGQWVQEFKKDASQTLTDAITKQFLANYSSKDCFVQTLADYYQSYGVPTPKISDNVEEAVIAYPKASDPNAPFWQNSDKCPQTYSATNGISYFYMDKNHPDKYFFFSIGQYAILSDVPKSDNDGVPWQDTFQVNK